MRRLLVAACFLALLLSGAVADASDGNDKKLPAEGDTTKPPAAEDPAKEPAQDPAQGDDAPEEEGGDELEPASEKELVLPETPSWERVGFTWGALSGQNSSVCTDCALPPITSIGPMKFCNAPLFGSWIGAVFIGLVGGWALLKQGRSVIGARAGSVSYLLYAIMITSGIVVHTVFLVECGVPLDKASAALYLFVAYADGVLTSCIAISFTFAALVDLRWLDESKCHTWLSMILAYVGVALAYFFYPTAEVILYAIVIAVCCGGYLLLQLLRMYIQDDARGIAWFLLAGAAGAASLAAISIPDIQCFLCEHFGMWILEVIWYYGADVTMAILLRYILATRSHVSGTPISSNVVPYTRVANY